MDSNLCSQCPSLQGMAMRHCQVCERIASTSHIVGPSNPAEMLEQSECVVDLSQFVGQMSMRSSAVRALWFT